MVRHIAAPFAVIASLGMTLFVIGRDTLATVSSFSSAPSSINSNVSIPSERAAWSIYGTSDHIRSNTGKAGRTDGVLVFATGVARDIAKAEAQNMMLKVVLPTGMYLDSDPSTVVTEKGAGQWSLRVGQAECLVSVWGQTVVECPLSRLTASDKSIWDGQSYKDGVQYDLQLSPYVTAEGCGAPTTLTVSLESNGASVTPARSYDLTIPCPGACTDFCGGFGQDLCDSFHAPGCAWQANGMLVSANCVKTPQCAAPGAGSSSSASPVPAVTPGPASSSSVSSQQAVVASVPSLQQPPSSVARPSSIAAVPSSRSASSIPLSGGRKYCCLPVFGGEGFSCQVRSPDSWYNLPSYFRSGLCYDGKIGTSEAGYDSLDTCATTCTTQRYCCSSDALNSPYSCILTEPSASGQCPRPLIGTQTTGYPPTATGQRSCAAACALSACCAKDGSGGCTARSPGQCFTQIETEVRARQCSVSLCCTGANREVRDGQCACKTGYVETLGADGSKSCVQGTTIACCNVGAGTCADRAGGCVAGEVTARQRQCSEGLCCTGGRAWKEGKCACPPGTTPKGDSCVSTPWTVTNELSTPLPVRPGQVVAYKVKIVRNGTAYDASEGLSVTLSSANASIVPSSILGGCMPDRATWRCPLPSIAADSSVEFEVRYVVKSDGPCDGIHSTTHFVMLLRSLPGQTVVVHRDSLVTELSCDASNGGAQVGQPSPPAPFPPSVPGQPVAQNACCFVEDNRPTCAMNVPDCVKRGFIEVPNTQCSVASCSTRPQRCCCKGGAPLGGKKSDAYGACIKEGGTWMGDAPTCAEDTCAVPPASPPVPVTTAPPVADPSMARPFPESETKPVALPLIPDVGTPPMPSIVPVMPPDIAPSTVPSPVVKQCGKSAECAALASPWECANAPVRCTWKASAFSSLMILFKRVSGACVPAAGCP